MMRFHNDITLYIHVCVITMYVVQIENNHDLLIDVPII